MEEKYNESTSNRPDGDRVLNASFVVSDLEAYSKQITEEDAYANGDRNAITLFKAHHTTVTLIALKSGAEMSTPEPSGKVALIQVLSGNIDVETGSETSSIGHQQLICLHSHLPYYIAATEDSVCLLTYCN